MKIIETTRMQNKKEEGIFSRKGVRLFSIIFGFFLLVSCANVPVDHRYPGDSNAVGAQRDPTGKAQAESIFEKPLAITIAPNDATETSNSTNIPDNHAVKDQSVPTPVSPDSAEQKKQEKENDTNADFGTLLDKSVYVGQQSYFLFIAEKNPSRPNRILWNAALQTLSFMPLKNVDISSGVIITDWQENPQNNMQRFFVTVTISSPVLAQESLQVSVFQQQKEEGQWRYIPVLQKTNFEVKKAILYRAKQIASFAQ